MSSGYTSPASMIAVGAVLPALDIIAVALRFLARKRQQMPLLLDDWLMIPALLFTIAIGVDIIVGVAGHGLGYPAPPPDVPGPEGPVLSTDPARRLVAQVEWISLWLQPWALGCIKLSILAFYRRVFDAHKEGFYHILIEVMMVLTTLWMLGFFFAELFMCGTHFSNLWGPYIVLFTECANGHALWIDEAFAISDFCLDVLVFFLPLPKIWSLQMSAKRRWLVTLVFLIGALAVVGSVIRMVIFIQSEEGIESSLTTVDGDILVARFLFWSMLEAGLAVVASCLPTVNSLLGRFSAIAILRSIRSALSLSSIRSNRSGIPEHPEGHAQVTYDFESSVSTNASLQSKAQHLPVPPVVYHGRGTNTYVMSDITTGTGAP